MGRKPSVVTIVFVVLAIGGCFAVSPAVEDTKLQLRVFNVSEQPVNDSIRVQTTVTMSGHLGEEFTVEGVEVCFLDDDGETMATVPVGTFSNNRSMDVITAELPRKPSTIALGYDSFDTDADRSVKGYRRIDSDTYEGFLQQGSRC